MEPFDAEELSFRESRRVPDHNLPEGNSSRKDEGDVPDSNPLAEERSGLSGYLQEQGPFQVKIPEIGERRKDYYEKEEGRRNDSENSFSSNCHVLFFSAMLRNAAQPLHNPDTRLALLPAYIINCYYENATR